MLNRSQHVVHKCQHRLYSQQLFIFICFRQKHSTYDRFQRLSPSPFIDAHHLLCPVHLFVCPSTYFVKQKPPSRAQISPFMIRVVNFFKFHSKGHAVARRNQAHEVWFGHAAKGRWCFESRKVTVGLEPLCLAIRHISVSYKNWNHAVYLVNFHNHNFKLHENHANKARKT